MSDHTQGNGVGDAVKLAPCPFCGCDEPHLVTNRHANMSWVSCIVCGLEAPSETGVTPEDAIRYWNARTPADGEVEPVAWRWTTWPHADIDGEEWPWTLTEQKSSIPSYATVQPLYATPTPNPAPSLPYRMQWCQPLRNGEQTPRVFIVRFEDQDRGDAVFTDEAEARDFFARANTNWNCYLFGTLEANPAPSGEAVPVGYVTRDAIELMASARPGWHYHMFAKDQSDPKATVALYASPTSPGQGVEVTDAMVERATDAAVKVMPLEFRGEIGVGDFDRMIRAVITAALSPTGGSGRAPE